MSTRSDRQGSTPYPFEPSGGATLAVTTTSGSVALAGSGDQAVVTNPGTVAVYAEFGTSTVVATVASLCVLAGASVLVTIPETSAGVKATYLAAITATGTATIQASTGWGL
jgi:hypothetical protein